MKKKIKIKFEHVTYFGKPIVNVRDYFLSMTYLFDEFDFILSDKPDFVITNKAIPKGPYTRIYINPENVRPPINHAEWLFGPDYEEDINCRNYRRQPNYVKLGAGTDLIDVKKNIDIHKILKEKTKFCAFIYANPVPIRNDFFYMLSKYKRVDSPGVCCNNMRNIGNYSNCQTSRMRKTFCDEVIQFLKPYKFVIAFENSSYPGYCSEKIYHPMLVNTIPIYWGNPKIYKDFNPKSFIHPYGKIKNIAKEKMLNYLVEKTIELDTNQHKYIEYLRRPWYTDNIVPTWLDKTEILNHYRKIFHGEK